MKTYSLIIKSKNKNSLYKFFNFLSGNINLNFNYLKKTIKKKGSKKIITILKSPHVNKTAQEQFEVKLLSKQLKINPSQKFKFIIFIKKITNYLFPDVYVKVKFFNDSRKNKTLNKKIISPDNFKNTSSIENYKNLDLKKLKQIKRDKYCIRMTKNNQNLLKILDVYGRY